MPQRERMAASNLFPAAINGGLQEHQRRQQTFGVFLPGHYREREDAVHVEMEPGDGVFFNALIIHGSAANTSDLPRRMNTFAYNVYRQRSDAVPAGIAR